MSTPRNRTFTPLDADTWDALVQSAQQIGNRWYSEMSNQSLGLLLGTNRRLASSRAKRLVDVGMVSAEYRTTAAGLPMPKVYEINPEWLGKSPQVGDYYSVKGS